MVSHQFWIIVHLAAMAVGLGGATISDIFFFRFLRDLRISKWESKVLHTFSRIIWIALTVVVLSGLALYLPQAQELNEVSKFVSKMIVFGVIIVNGLVLNLYVSPKLTKISFKSEADETARTRFPVWRSIAFACGSISITSWYTVLVFATLPRLQPLSVSQFMMIYGLVLLFAISGSLLVERIYDIIGDREA